MAMKAAPGGSDDHAAEDLGGAGAASPGFVPCPKSYPKRRFHSVFFACERLGQRASHLQVLLELGSRNEIPRHYASLGHHDRTRLRVE
jgi:hypothetical protein